MRSAGSFPSVHTFPSKYPAAAAERGAIPSESPDLHVVNQKGEAQIHSELMRMYEDELTRTQALALT